MVLFSEMFVSELLDRPVIDRIEEPIGKVKDIIIATGEVFPKVTGFLVFLEKEKKDAVILMGDLDLIGKKFVSTKTMKERVAFSSVRPDDVLLQRDILDGQVVDIEGARVVRINDLKLAKMDADIRLIAADVGIHGLLRRLGLESFIEKFLSIFRLELPVDILIGWNHVEPLKTDFKRGKIAIPRKRMVELHPADIAYIISQVHTEERSAIFASLSDKTAAEALHELEPKIQAYLLTTVDTKKALNILDKMPVDEAADVIGDLPEEKAEDLLRLMKIRKATEIRKLLKHHEETAGGLMTTEFIILSESFTAEQTINRLRELAPDTETIYYLYVVDAAEKLVGVLSLRNLIIAKPETPLSEIMVKEVISVPPEAGKKKVADTISKYNLLAVPVVDKEGKILGIVTVDDVVDFIIPPISRRKRQMIG